ncbi:MAG: hypothetical protein JWM67_175 [Mycobacterium sp.]|nr:hypothetical protein [Mycobacterium sp.]
MNFRYRRAVDDCPRRYVSPVRAEQAERTRARILDAAAGLFLERGYGATTLRGIADAAGVAVPTVTAAFGNKPGLVRAVVERAAFGAGYQQALAAMRGGLSPRERLRTVATVARRVHEASARYVGLLLATTTAEPALQPVVDAVFARRRYGQGVVARALAEAGLLRADLDADAALELMLALTDVAVWRALVEVGGFPPDSYEEHLARLLAAAVLDRP